MAPIQSYAGPTALAYSRYAMTPQRQAAIPPMPAAVSSSAAASVDKTIATKEQIAAADNSSALDTSSRNADAQLAIVGGNALKVDVDKHGAMLSRKVSNAVTNTRKLLDLLQESLPKDGTAALATVDRLWNELEQVFAAANDTKVKIPEFLEKQRNNMSLYYTSIIHDNMHENQQELNTLHKKVNLQHTLIMEHQEAFQDFKVHEDAVKADLQGQNSRLTLEKGIVRNEADGSIQKVDTLKKQFQLLESTYKGALVENEALRNNVKHADESDAAAQQKITHAEKELATSSEQLAKEVQKTAGLSATIKTLRDNCEASRAEINKLKLENKTAIEKSQEQVAAHAEVFTKFGEETKKNAALSKDVDRLQQEVVELQERVVKIVELEKQIKKLSEARIGLLEQIKQLATELDAAKSVGKEDNTKIESLVREIAKNNREIENLNTKNIDLLSTQKEIQLLKSENSKLNATIDELRAGGAAQPVGGVAISDDEKKALELKIRGLEMSVCEWTDLAKRSYKEYKDMLPAYRQAEDYRKAAAEMGNEIKELKLELSTIKASQSNGVGSGGDAAYWKNKYESLLATVGE